jgi:hypothetical protein
LALAAIQVLEARFDRIEMGMSGAEVEQILGPPNVSTFRATDPEYRKQPLYCWPGWRIRGKVVRIGFSQEQNRLVEFKSIRPDSE